MEDEEVEDEEEVTEDEVVEEEDEEEPVSEPRREERPSSSSLTDTRVSSSPRARCVFFSLSVVDCQTSGLGRAGIFSPFSDLLTDHCPLLSLSQEHLLVTRNLVPGDSVYGEKVRCPTPPRF